MCGPPVQLLTAPPSRPGSRRCGGLPLTRFPPLGESLAGEEVPPGDAIGLCSPGILGVVPVAAGVGGHDR